MLEEIVVTAQKREERIQDVPISAQVIGGETLSRENHTSLEELAQTIPAVHISAGDYSDNLFIRGIGSGPSNPSYDQSVSVFIDDIYHGRSRMSQGIFLDLDRIEVLKGPQSTFFGNNAIAGALNIVTRKPGSEVEASGRVLYGQFGQYGAEAAVGGPLSDSSGARIAVIRSGDTTGWIENVNLDHKVPQVNNLAGRVTLNYRPVADLDATLKIEGSEHRTAGSYGGQPSQWVNCPPAAPIAPGFSGVCSQALTRGLPVGLETDQTAGLPGQGNRLSTFEDVLTVNYHLSGGVTLTSVSGFFNYHFSAAEDDGLLPVFVYKTAEPVEKYHQVSQELRIASPSGGRIEYLGGAYFQVDELPESITINAPFLNSVGTRLGAASYLPLSFQPRFTQDERIYSLFGSLGWNATDALKLNAGVRGSLVNKDFTGALHYGTSRQVYGSFTPIPATVESEWSILEGAPGTQALTRSDRAWMPSGGVQYRLASQAMTYFTYTRGFKPGGFNGLLPNLGPDEVMFGPEHVNAYELGVKGTWFDGRIRTNFDVFRSDYRGLQSNTIVHQAATNTNVPVVRNAAESRSQGVEFDGEWLTVSDLRFAANATYLDSHYVRYPNATGTTLQQFCAVSYVVPYCSGFPIPVPLTADLSGQPTAEAPRVSGSVRANYRIRLLPDRGITTEVSSYWTTAYSATGADPNDPLYHVGGYVRLDARVSFEALDGRLALDVIGKNLTDRVIIAKLGGASSMLYSGSKEMPRNVVVQVRVQW
jgi:iron complex outermembrane recepter protein